MTDSRYPTPEPGAMNWHEDIDANFAALTTDVERRDAGDPGTNGYEAAEGAKYLDTDTGVIYVSDGDSWEASHVIGRLIAVDGDTHAVFGPGAIDGVSVDGSLAVSGDVDGGDEWTVTVVDDDEPTEAGNVIQGYPGNVVEDANGVTIAGGGRDEEENVVSGDFSAIGGGRENESLGTRNVIAGGERNLIDSSRSAIGGGRRNTISSNRAVIGGGDGNQADAAFDTIGGGWGNTVSGTRGAVVGGRVNVASGERSFVGGGGDSPILADHPDDGNEAAGVASVVPGGGSNVAGGDWSLAAGRGATINENHEGTFLWGDSTGDAAIPFESAAADEFAARATGGVRLVTGLDAADEPDSGLFCDGETARFEMDSVQINTQSTGARLYVEADSAEDNYLFRVRDSGTTKLMVDDNGGTSVGTFSTPPADGLLVGGDMEVSGDKNFVHPAGDSEVVYSSQESGRARTVWDEANVVLSGGADRVALPDHFRTVTAGSEPLTVQVTPRGTPVSVAVAEKSLEDGIDVVTDSDEDVTVDITVKGVREGYEDKTIVRPATVEPSEETAE